MGRLFIWLSGVDRDLLAKSTNLQRSERTRFAGLGALVLIPAVLSLLSMTYAISTVVNNPWIYVSAGIVWSGIILAIDRYLVSTLYRSQLPNRRVLGPLVSRYLFAILIGLAVAHPVVLLWFDQSISQHIAEDRRQAVAERLQKAEDHKKALREGAASQTSEEISKRLTDRTKRLDCLRELQTAEQSGRRVQLSCGFSSGVITCRERCNKIGAQIAEVEREVTQLSSQLAAAQKADQGVIVAERRDRRAQAKRIDDTAAKDVKEIEAKFSDDYLARVSALEDIAANSPQVKVVQWFIILFFIFVDILPVTMKVATPMGEYEEIRDTRLLDRQMKEQVDREIARTGVGYKAVAQAKARHAAMKDEISALADVILDLFKSYEERTADFENRVRAVSRRIPRNEELQRQFIEHTTSMRTMINRAWSKGFAQFMAYLEKL